VVRGRLQLSGHAEHPASPPLVRRRPAEAHAILEPNQRLLVEYKPFEPAFYHTDIADWGMSLDGAQRRPAGQGAGGYRPSLPGAEHRADRGVAAGSRKTCWAAFHFNDRRYADDDLTLGSIDPYQVFRIFHEIALFEWETGRRADIAYMVDQSHNLKDKIEEMIQTVQSRRRNSTPRPRWWITKNSRATRRSPPWWMPKSA
jgi:L-rhamnose isomerase / sugar isomerase